MRHVPLCRQKDALGCPQYRPQWLRYPLSILLHLLEHLHNRYQTLHVLFEGIRPSPSRPLRREVLDQLYDLGEASAGGALAIAEELQVDRHTPVPLGYAVIMVSVVKFLQLPADLVAFLPLKGTLDGVDEELGSLERAIVLLFGLH